MSDSTSSDWRSGGVTAWSTHDGPGVAPRGPRGRLLGSLAASMSAVWVGMVATDTLCPEHRLWVDVLASVALVFSVTAIVGLVGRRVWAPLAAIVSALAGVAIGIVDAVHSVTRGVVIAVLFALVALAAAALAWGQLSVVGWRQRTVEALRPEPPITFGDETGIESDGQVDVPTEQGAVEVSTADGATEQGAAELSTPSVPNSVIRSE